MEKFKRIIKKIFFLPPVPMVLFAVFGYTFVILVFALEIHFPAVEYLSYICSAYALIITITGFPHFIAFGKAVRRYLYEHPLVKKIRGTAIGMRFFSDVRFRTEMSLYQGLFINLLYIVIKMFSGIYYRSFWFISLAVYYILLAVMRILLLHKGKWKKSIPWKKDLPWKEDITGKTDGTMIEIEIRRYRLCGIMLLVMNQALAGIVIFMVRQNKGFNYPGLLIYAMALYSFYSVITAVVNLIKFRRHGSPILSAAKAINLVAAMVSILSLETAMVAQFGGDDEEFRAVMTGATGGGVCTIVIGMAIFMIWKSTRQMKKLKIERSI